MPTTYKTNLPSLTVDTDNTEAKTLLERSQREFGMVPNMFANLANLPGLLETYWNGRTLFIQQSGFTPAEQEVVFLTVSRENECEYCVGAHSFSGDYVSQVPAAVTDAIRDGKEIPDAKLKALADFILTMMHKHGNPTAADVAPFHAAGYTDTHILGIILAIGIKTMSNYTNHIFHTELDSMMTARAWKPKN
jgi:uncharacterized peroxidase-related enzyme